MTSAASEAPPGTNASDGTWSYDVSVSWIVRMSLSDGEPPSPGTVSSERNARDESEPFDATSVTPPSPPVKAMLSTAPWWGSRSPTSFPEASRTKSVPSNLRPPEEAFFFAPSATYAPSDDTADAVVCQPVLMGIRGLDTVVGTFPPPSSVTETAASALS